MRNTAAKMKVIAALFWLCIHDAASSSVVFPPPGEDILPLLKRQEDLPECRMNYTTDVWTTCYDVIVQFGLSLDDFIWANPSLSEGCAGFEAGETYCVVRHRDDFPISEDGSCGLQTNYTVSCVGSSGGDCCNADGFCGSGFDFCGPGNCQEGDCDGGIFYSLDGRCGRDFDYLVCPPKFGLCCSGAGHCGNLTQFCSDGCQSGPCLNNPSATTSSGEPTPTQPPGSISDDGTCGYRKQYVCDGSEYGDCCSAAGYCGSTEYHCSDYLGCQTNFGECGDW